MSANVSNKFSIKLCGKVFESNEEGMLDLNEIWRGCALEEKKRPSEWKTKISKFFRERGGLITSSKKITTTRPPIHCLLGSNEVVEAYVNWLGIGGSVVKLDSKEHYIYLLLKQIFKTVKRQYNIKDCFVDFYIPSIGLCIEYDELWHNTHKQRIEDAKRELVIGKPFFRIKEGEEVESLIKLQLYVNNTKDKITKTWLVDNKYHFTEEMEAYKFVVSNEENFKVEESTLPDFHKEHKFIVCNKNYSKIFFPKVAASQEECIPF